jgi:hypothetical protein
VDEPRGRQSFLGRTVAGTVGAARRRVENEVTGTAQGVINELEPYLAAETVPRIVDALVPHLVEKVVPQIIDDMTAHLATTTVPQILEQATPALVDELLPVMLERLRPYLEAELVPAVVDGITPHIIEATAPRVIDGLMPVITAQVVPAVLDGVADDPRIRALVREQSWGLLTDAIERFRQLLAKADDGLERLVRRLLRRTREVVDLLPAGQLPEGRRRSHAGVVSRLVGGAVDLSLYAFLASQSLAAALAVVEALLGEVPQLVAVILSTAAWLVGPTYLALSWSLASCTIGGLVGGFSVVASSGRRLGLLRATVRGLLSLLLGPVWAVGLLLGVVDPARRGLLDRLVGSRTPYRGPAVPRVPQQRSPSAPDLVVEPAVEPAVEPTTDQERDPVT